MLYLCHLNLTFQCAGFDSLLFVITKYSLQLIIFVIVVSTAVIQQWFCRFDRSSKKSIEIKLPSPPTEDFFTNDGSFMEKFLKLQGAKGE